MDIQKGASSIDVAHLILVIFFNYAENTFLIYALKNIQVQAQASSLEISADFGT